ncbi:MAG: GNAT family N-acetyltransferase [Bacteroidales bacterium]|nr:GNAT family N-acetyltransferase [Bacteroidales bacterium]
MKNKKVKLIYWSSDINCQFQNIISNNFKGRLVDIKTRYAKELRKFDRFLIDGSSSIEFYGKKKPDDRMMEIAVQCGEYSRFKVDPEFPTEKFVSLYKTWLIKSLTGDLADEVIIAKKDDIVTGLITLACKNGIGNIGLIGVHYDCRGMGHGGMLIKAALNYFFEKKCHTVTVVTQGMNKAACRLYEKFGFTVRDKTNFYHFWIQ